MSISYEVWEASNEMLRKNATAVIVTHGMILYLSGEDMTLMGWIRLWFKKMKNAWRG